MAAGACLPQALALRVCPLLPLGAAARVPRSRLPSRLLCPHVSLHPPAPQHSQTSVWYGCVLRGDLNHVKVGAFSNVQDRTVVTAAR